MRPRQVERIAALGDVALASRYSACADGRGARRRPEWKQVTAARRAFRRARARVRRTARAHRVHEDGPGAAAGRRERHRHADASYERFTAADGAALVRRVGGQREASHLRRTRGRHRHTDAIRERSRERRRSRPLLLLLLLLLHRHHTSGRRDALDCSVFGTCVERTSRGETPAAFVSHSRGHVETAVLFEVLVDLLCDHCDRCRVLGSARDDHVGVLLVLYRSS